MVCTTRWSLPTKSSGKIRYWCIREISTVIQGYISWPKVRFFFPYHFVYICYAPCSTDNSNNTNKFMLFSYIFRVLKAGFGNSLSMLHIFQNVVFKFVNFKVMSIRWGRMSLLNLRSFISQGNDIRDNLSYLYWFIIFYDNRSIILFIFMHIMHHMYRTLIFG